ncbi:MAG: Penicillinase repressor [Chloroflexi bacterium]|nr:Penicillinase repressor [Chloroflexota bacterium]
MTEKPAMDARAQVASASSGRIRIRLERDPQMASVLRGVEETLSRQPGVTSVRANSLARSVTITYKPSVLSGADILRTMETARVKVSPAQIGPIGPRGLFQDWMPGARPNAKARAGVLRRIEDIMVVFGALFESPEVSGDREPHTFSEAVRNLEQQIFLRTGYRIRLNTAIPVAVVGMGVVHVALYGIMIETIPGVVLIWFGLDAYLKLNPHLVYGNEVEQNVVDIIGLPDAQRKIVTWLLRQGNSSVEEIAQGCRTDEFATSAYLRELVDDGFVQEYEEDGRTQYRPTPTRKRGSSLATDIWDRIGLDAQPSEQPEEGPSRRKRGSSGLADRL